ncbi:MAG: hypothetical protein ACXU7G_13395 [Croceibacterium sp.]
MKTLLAFACSLLGMGVCLAAGPSVAQAQTCWLVYYVSSGAPDSADEVICLSSPTEGYVRETSIFGDVRDCNPVTVNRSGEAMDSSSIIRNAETTRRATRSLALRHPVPG